MKGRALGPLTLVPVVRGGLAGAGRRSVVRCAGGCFRAVTDDNGTSLQNRRARLSAGIARQPAPSSGASTTVAATSRQVSGSNP